MVLRGFLLALLGWGTAAQAAEPMQPDGRWRVDFAENQCVAIRTYDDGARTFLIKPAASGKVTEFIVVHEARDTSNKHRKAKIILDGAKHDGSVYAYTRKDSRQRFYRALWNGGIETLADVKEIGIDTDWVEFAFAVDHMPQLTEMLAHCIDDLRAYYGAPTVAEQAAIDAARAATEEENPDSEDDSAVEEARLADEPAFPSPARGDIRGLFSTSDYPDEAIREDANGSFRLFLLIDEEGKVADCSMQEFEGAGILGGQSCQVVINRAVFEPARDAEGNPTRDHYISPTIRWKTSW